MGKRRETSYKKKDEARAGHVIATKPIDKEPPIANPPKLIDPINIQTD